MACGCEGVRGREARIRDLTNTANSENPSTHFTSRHLRHYFYASFEFTLMKNANAKKAYGMRYAAGGRSPCPRITVGPWDGALKKNRTAERGCWAT